MTKKDEKEFVEYEHRLTAAETAEKGKQLATHMQEKRTIENEKKEAMSDFSARLDAKQTVIESVMNTINTGIEVRKGNLKVVKDFDHGVKRYYLEDGAMVKEIPLTAADHQVKAEFVDHTDGKGEHEEEEELPGA